jgi:hypothetical protein
MYRLLHCCWYCPQLYQTGQVEGGGAVRVFWTVVAAVSVAVEGEEVVSGIAEVGGLRWLRW